MEINGMRDYCIKNNIELFYSPVQNYCRVVKNGKDIETFDTIKQMETFVIKLIRKEKLKKLNENNN